MDSFRVVIGNPLPQGGRLDWVDLNPEITALSWTTGPGGYMACSVGYQVAGQPDGVAEMLRPLSVPDLANVQIWAGSESGFLCFEGRVQDVDEVSGLRVKALTAAGYGTAQGALGDEWFYTSDATDYSAAQLLRRMIPGTTDILRVGDADAFVDPEALYSAKGQSGRYLGQTLDQIIKAGAAGGYELMLAVYEDRRVQLRPILPPLDATNAPAPDYRVRLDQRVTWKRSGAKLVGAVAVQFTPPGGVQDTTQVAEVEGWQNDHGGLFRSMLIPSSQLTQIQAEQLRNRYLRRYSQPVITGTMHITRDRSLETRTGQPAPYYMVRYGQWLALGSQMFFITQTQIDASGGKATITFTNVPVK